MFVDTVIANAVVLLLISIVAICSEKRVLLVITIDSSVLVFVDSRYADGLSNAASRGG